MTDMFEWMEENRTLFTDTLCDLLGMHQCLNQITE
jgi:hypothetical protein